MNKVLSFCLVLLFSVALAAQPMFSNQSGLLSSTTIHSGVAMAVVDMNKDGLDDIVRLDNGTTFRIDFQEPGGGFSSYISPVTFSSRTWGVTVADVDQNGIRDIAVGGTGGSTGIWFASEPSVPLSFSNFPLAEVIFLQGANFTDIDNDGLVDFFACDDVDISKPYRADGGQSMTYDLGLMPAFSTVPSDNSGNYASLWTDYDDDGDVDMYLSKCRGGVGDPGDGRRRNQLFRNEGDGTFTDVAGATGLLPLAQTWSTDFADIDNDGDMDCFVVNHDKSGALYRNDGNNVFTDVTVSTDMASSLPVTSNGIQCNFEDFNNDGWIDLLLTHNSGIPLFIYQNEGGMLMKPLTEDDLIGPTTERGLQSVATGDLNNDGYIDIYGGFAEGYNSPSSTKADVLMINNLSGNNHLKFQLTGTSSNIDGIGAKIKVHDEDFGTQVREVRSGEGYGIMNSLTQHFGLGTTAVVDSVVIRWPSGLTERAYNVLANQTLVVEEGTFDQALPLEWQSFTAVAAGKQVQLDWATSQERGASHFLIERTADLVNWSLIGRAESRNEIVSQNYQAVDQAPLPGTSYYRLQQVDLDGVFAYSPIATVSFGTGDFSVFPNPAGDWVQVHGNNNKALYSIESIDGRIIRQAAPAIDGRLSLSGLLPGVYLIRSGDEVRRVVHR